MAEKQVHPVVITKDAKSPTKCHANRFVAQRGDDVVFAFNNSDNVSDVRISFDGESPFSGPVELKKNMTIRVDAVAKTYQYTITWRSLGVNGRGAGSGDVQHGR